MKEATRLTCYLPIIIVLAADLCVGIRFSAQLSEGSITDTANQQQLQTAVFALGSFWRSEAVFGCLDGVVRTTVGYAGGSKTNPEYRSLGDHAESVQMDGLRIPNKDLADLTPHFVWSKAEMLQLMKQMTKGRKDNLFLRKHCWHMMLAQPAQYVMEAGNKRLSV
ncbi:peptide methionine sulfoxide reductase A5-like [Coffea eugenioides]|uniref:peptide methionine sulfoxide reductase A5-like n=1 Tax=Coffea eugenioides TaxID=49369 RepID=UPI000F60C89D|nr:peptide methionine sulfoxide reductase A5-like [Coffea eugenioides]XP_027178578.1 peptide methionine sulfoxide reductase A5-like [Coffea eugenioides]XP_027178579.1 peptide methionine sulfoxide reductase A5-like [Coffea eugenioides]XP_027178580.1 peptide methionine sulfoxide reductase A5-like [Coffea eugenioides]